MIKIREFNLFGYNFKIGDNLELYNSYRILHMELVNDVQLEFRDFLENCSDVQNLIKGYSTIANKFIIKAIDKNIENLYTLGITTIDKSIFINKYGFKYFNYNTYLSPIEEEYIKITQTSKELERYRALQKSSRGKWQGGGFGVKGAIKGAATAGALNFGSSVLHSFGDTSKSISDNSKISAMKTNILNDYKKNGKLEIGIINCIMGCFHAFIEELVSNNRMSPVTINEKEALATYNNTIQYEKDINKIIENLLGCILRYPYNPNFYEILYSINSKEEGLLSLVEFFGLDKGLCKQYKQKYDQIDLEQRTFNNITYDTKEERELAENEYKLNLSGAIQTLTKSIEDNNIDFEKIDKNTYDKCLDILDYISKKYRINILEDVVIKNAEHLPELKSIKNIKKYIKDYQNVEKNASEYENIKSNPSEIPKEKYLNEDDDVSFGGILVCAIIDFALYKFMNAGLLRNILVGFMTLSVIGNFITMIGNYIKKQDKLNELKRDYEKYNKIK